MPSNKRSSQFGRPSSRSPCIKISSSDSEESDSIKAAASQSTVLFDLFSADCEQNVNVGTEFLNEYLHSSAFFSPSVLRGTCKSTSCGRLALKPFPRNSADLYLIPCYPVTTIPKSLCTNSNLVQPTYTKTLTFYF